MTKFGHLPGPTSALAKPVAPSKLQPRVARIAVLREAPNADAGHNQGQEASVVAGDMEGLLSLWSKERRARGGWWALAGFSFQSVVYLQRFFEGLQSGAKSPASSQRPSCYPTSWCRRTALIRSSKSSGPWIAHRWRQPFEKPIRSPSFATRSF
jgi:hypothetical protein